MVHAVQEPRRHLRQDGKACQDQGQEGQGLEGRRLRGRRRARAAEAGPVARRQVRLQLRVPSLQRAWRGARDHEVKVERDRTPERGLQVPEPGRPGVEGTGRGFAHQGEEHDVHRRLRLGGRPEVPPLQEGRRPDARGAGLHCDLRGGKDPGDVAPQAELLFQVRRRVGRQRHRALRLAQASRHPVVAALRLAASRDLREVGPAHREGFHQR
mmetsp:Transcript_59895/g.165759  ORF Transcript_59895/g.165759 Transcript_59895/m.165759 type:complete len:212 (-) Transcript_59895:836-1471(-)